MAHFPFDRACNGYVYVLGSFSPTTYRDPSRIVDATSPTAAGSFGYSPQPTSGGGAAGCGCVSTGGGGGGGGGGGPN